jgi:hypothetical protein
VIDIYLICT